MDGDVLSFAQVMLVIAMFSAFGTLLYFSSRFASAALNRKKNQPVSVPQIDESRFERLEQAVDSIAIEVERISEAQRFSAKLMSDRLPDRADSDRKVLEPGS